MLNPERFQPSAPVRATAVGPLLQVVLEGGRRRHGGGAGSRDEDAIPTRSQPEAVLGSHVLGALPEIGFQARRLERLTVEEASHGRDQLAGDQFSDEPHGGRSVHSNINP